MRTLLALFLAAPLFAALPSVSGIWATDISHASALIHVQFNNATNGDGSYWENLRECWSVSPTACAAGTGTTIPTGYPNDAGNSINTRVRSESQFIFSGMYPPSSVVYACPQFSNDGTNWSTTPCVAIQLLGVPAAHAKGATDAVKPRGYILPVMPDTTGFHVAASVGGAATVSNGPGTVSGCAALINDIHEGVIHQTSYGTLITLAAGEASKCTGRFWAYDNPPDVRTFSSGNVDSSASRITVASHTWPEGRAVMFSAGTNGNTTNLPGEHADVTRCIGIKPGEVYYVHSPTTNDFQLTCEQPYTQGGALMQMADGGGGNDMFVAPYPRMRADGGSLYPIVIRTSTPDAQLPPAGVRMDPRYSTANKLAILQADARGQIVPYSGVGGTAIRVFTVGTGDVYADSNRFLNAGLYFMGVEIETADAAGDSSSDPVPSFGLIDFKEGSSFNTFDRCYIHGAGNGWPNRVKEGIPFEGQNNAIINSYFDRIIYPYQVLSGFIQGSAYWFEGSQLIQTALGPGPLIFLNNYFESTGNGWHINAAAFPEKRVHDILVKRNTFTQPMKYCYGSPTSDGYEYQNRQPYEQKGGTRSWLDGNLWDNDCHYIAGTMLALTAVADTIMDVSVTNNTFRHVSSVGQMGSSTQGGALQTPPTSRYLWRNNLMWDVDGTKHQDQKSGFGSTVGGVFSWNGWIIHAMETGEDMIFDHNTVWKPNGAHPAMFWLGYGAAEGTVITNNFLFGYSDQNFDGHGARQDGGNGINFAPACQGKFAKDLLTCQTMFPDAVITNNVISSDSSSQATVQGWWPGQLVPTNPSDLTLLGFMNPDITKKLPNFRLKHTSPYIHAASDGTAVGADIDVLEAAQGKVTLTGAVPASTSATVNFVAPDGASCPVDVITGSSAALYSGAPTRYSDSGTTPGPRSVAISGLSAHSNYFFRVNCAVEQPLGSFHTN